MTARTGRREAKIRPRELTMDPDSLPEALSNELALRGAESAAVPFPFPFPFPFPLLFGVSGLYESSPLRPVSPTPPVSPISGVAENGSEPAAELATPRDSRLILREALRLDVDGRYPQMAASGTIYQFLTERTHWVARLTQAADGDYSGPIWFLDGDVSTFPFDTVTIRAFPSPFPHQKRAKVTFSGSGTAKRVRVYRFVSRDFHPCEFEYDTVEDTEALTSIGTGDHPNRPPGLPVEDLSIETVYRRAGFTVTRTSGGPAIPVSGTGANGLWSDSEMHDAMQVYWSKFANKGQWSLWTLFARQHDSGFSLGGVMFDDIGPNHRQGTAVFNESFIAQAPAGDPNPDAWIARMRFWTAVHEIGHTFNLAHSWQKVHPPSWGTSWTPLTNEPEARSFMNYPYNVSGGESAFFASFEYRFSDQELLFMRHAPERFVQQGNAAWFDQHGFEQTRRSSSPRLSLEVRTNRAKANYEFMEPVVLELKLKNISNDLQIVDDHLLATSDRLTVAIKREGRPARQFSPYAQYCWHSGTTVLPPDEAVYESLFVGAGMNGWDLAEPGRYVVQVALHLDAEDVISPPLMIRIEPPRGFDEELLAQDLFTDDVGRVLAFDGSRALTSANDTLREVGERLPARRVAIHAKVALVCPLAKAHKQLHVDPAKPEEERLKFKAEQPKVEEAAKEFRSAVAGKQQESAESLGHIDYADYAIRFSWYLAQEGERGEASEIATSMLTTLASRDVPPDILAQLQARLPDTQEAQPKGNGKKRPSQPSRAKK